MWARVLLVLLAGVPVCRGADGASGDSYSQYHEAHDDNETPDFYNNYEEEIRNFRIPHQMTTDMENTRLKRNYQEVTRTLNPNEIDDVKGMLNDIMQRKQPVSIPREPAREFTNSYEYLENSNNLGTADRTAKVYQLETSTFSKDDIIGEVRPMMPEAMFPHRSSVDFATTVNTEATENSIDFYPQESTTYSNSFMEAVVNNLVHHWSPTSNVGDPQQFTESSKTEIQAEVKNWVQQWVSRVKDPQESTESSNSKMEADVKKWLQQWVQKRPRVTDSYSEEATEYSNSEMQADVKNVVQVWKPSDKKNDAQESTEYSKSKMQADVKKLVQQWKPSGKENDAQESTEYSKPKMGADVKKLVQQWKPSGKENDAQESTEYSISKMRADVKKLVQQWKPSGKENDAQESTEYSKTKMRADVKKLVQQWKPSGKENDAQESTEYSKSKMRADVKKLVQQWRPSGKKNDAQESTEYSKSNMQADVKKLVQQWKPSGKKNEDNPEAGQEDKQEAEPEAKEAKREGEEPTTPTETSATTMTESSATTATETSATTMTESSATTATETSGTTATETSGTTTTETSGTTAMETSSTTTTESSGTTTTESSGTTTTVSSGTTTTESSGTTTTEGVTTTVKVTPRMDIDAIMAIISNLTYDYEWNLTEQFNKTIIDHGVPTCAWEKWGPGGIWTAGSVKGPTEFPWDFDNSSVVSKCFVCGLKATEIPMNAYCADAFAGDFLPLMPIDARSRSMIANYRKYCRYIDVQNYIENPEEPRAIYGRFTGGCAVRWTDLTGIYTQRTCRSRYRPLLGKHFASKRMAKLELALVNVDNGCIISPMATLLPVSRGISLYARFHACVCTANWCNRASLETTSINAIATIILGHWLAQLAHYS